MLIFLSGFRLGGGLDADAPTGGLIGDVSPNRPKPRLRV